MHHVAALFSKAADNLPEPLELPVREGEDEGPLCDDAPADPEAVE